MAVTIGVLKETTAGETRVALVPEVIAKYSALGATLVVENGAGDGSRIPDALFDGAEVSPNPQGILAKAGFVTWDVPPLKSGLIPNDFLPQLAALGKAAEGSASRPVHVHP